MTLSDLGVVCVSSSTASTNTNKRTVPASIQPVHSQESYHVRGVPAPRPMERCASNTSTFSFNGDICRICHCEGDAETPLIAPCYCAGSLRYVHQSCLQQWIKSSDTKCCELCKFNFIMHSKIKPFNKWERLDMSGMEQRKIACSVTFHVVAITCVVWSLYVLIERTTEEVQEGTLEWPFWTKLIVVAIGFTGGLVFMYVQCKMYVQLCKRWRAFNRVIYVQNAPEKVPLSERDRMELQRDPGPQMSVKEACSEPPESDKSLMGVSIITGTTSHHDLINPSTTTTSTNTSTCPHHTLASAPQFNAPCSHSPTTFCPACPHTVTSTTPFSAPCSHTPTGTTFSAACPHSLINTHTSTSAPTCPHTITSGPQFSAPCSHAPHTLISTHTSTSAPTCPHTLTSTTTGTPYSTSSTTTTSATPPGAVWTDTQPGFTGLTTAALTL